MNSYLSKNDRPEARFRAETPCSGTVRLNLGENKCDWVDVVYLSHRTLALASSSLPREYVKGEVLKEVEATFDERTVNLPRLRVVRSSPEDGSLVLEPIDDETRVALWRAVYLGGGPSKNLSLLNKSTEHEFDTSVESIPARGQDTEEARLERLEFARSYSGAALASFQETPLVSRRLSGNIENFIGSVSIPVGLAGPLLFKGSEVEGVVFAPFGTSEGTLVASASRGARALSRSGGVVTRVLGQRMLRAPLFVASTLHGALVFSQWLRDHQLELTRVVGEVSRHARLIDVNPMVIGRHVHAQFLYETGDAAGQNMTTTCTWHACQWILEQMKYFDEVYIENFVVEANMSSDKKVTYQSFVSGRGTRVIAEAILKRQVVEDVLKVSVEQLLRTASAFVSGSIQAGMIGFNINVANVVAALFTATGQDIACVHESSLAQLHIEPDAENILVSLLLPGLIVGTVGGGTQLPAQHECLEILGCTGSSKMARLAEIIAGFCLSLDLSTLSAIASGQFAHAHERLGRNRPVNWLSKEELSPEFFEPWMREAIGDPAARVTQVMFKSSANLGSSIITELTARKVQKMVGHFPMSIKVLTNGSEEEIDVIAKVKPLDEEIILMLSSMASMCIPSLASNFGKFKSRLEFTGTDRREVEIYRQTDERFIQHVPKVYGSLCDPEREAFVIVLEHLKDVELINTADDVGAWTKDHIVAAIDGIAQIHSIWYDKEIELATAKLGRQFDSVESMTEMSPLFRSLADNAREEFSRWYRENDRAEAQRIIEEIPEWWIEYEKLPRTLVHGDFNPRNLCFRREADMLRLCLYDWELAMEAPPQRDLAELLVFVLSENSTEEDVAFYVDRHRVELEKATRSSIAPDQWRQGYSLALLDLTINRFGLYLMAHTFRHYAFMDRCITVLRRLRQIEAEKERQ